MVTLYSHALKVDSAVYSMYLVHNGSCVLQNILSADMEQVGLIHIKGRNVKWYNSLENIWQFLQLPMSYALVFKISINSSKFYCHV